MKSMRWLSWMIAFVVFHLGLEIEAHAGATASQWVVVVNGDSLNSRTVANYYCELRNIPSRNVIVLKEVPPRESIEVEEFRTKILNPLFAEIDARGLSPHLQGIAYSADFPTAIDFALDTLELKERSPYLLPVGSINGLTYLYAITRAKSPSLLSMESNCYASRDLKTMLEKSPPPSIQEDWKNFEQKLKESQFDEAKRLNESIVKKCPLHPGVSYLAARLWAKAGKKVETLDMLELSISQGWCHRDYLLNDPDFAPFHQESRFQFLRESCDEISEEHSRGRGFDARTFWSPAGVPVASEQDGVRYLLSVALAATRGDGNRVEEVIKYLKSSAAADFTQPEGKFYFTKTEDVRTTTRVPFFKGAQERLKQLGYESEVVEDRMPMFQKGCLGVTMGAPSFQWRASASTLVPGAIAENLTSLGGSMSTQGDQTKLTEFLKYGAAGSSGAVVEPYTIPAKFPLPMIHAHYADGATLAEAFYLSVHGPYQLLIVGDPLCQPFAEPPKVQSKGLPEDGVMADRKVRLRLTPESTLGESMPSRMEILMDGRLLGTQPFSTRLDLNIAGDISDGAHELRFLFTDSSPMQRKWEFAKMIQIGPPQSKVEIAIEPAKKDSDKGPVIGETNAKLGIRVRGKKGSRIRLMHHYESLGELESDQGRFEIDLSALGKGPVRLHAVSFTETSETQSLPIVVQSE